MKIKPIEYAQEMCGAIMHMYEPEDLPPKGAFFYHQGVFLSGMQQVYKYTGDKKYFNYIKRYVDSVIDKNGEIVGYEMENVTTEDSWFVRSALALLDSKQPVILLYDLYDETKDFRYEKAIKTVADSMHFWPWNSHGGYWHMMLQPNQMWLDGAYMVGALACKYDKYYGDEILRERAIKQVLLMDRFMKDEKSGLYFHGWDESKQEKWADKETGLSSEIWGRAVGWYAVAILDIIDLIPENHPKIEKLKQIERELLSALVKFQDKKTGLWFEVLNKPNMADNWVETSCSCLFIYSYARAINMGIVSAEEFSEILERAYDGIADGLTYDNDGYIILGNVCVGTCIDEGTYEHYVQRPVIQNDLHGSGAFVLMCEEVQRYFDLKDN